VPASRVPSIGGTAVVVLALPVFLVADWRLAAWVIAAVLWAAYLLIGGLLGRVPTGSGHLAAAGFVAVVRMGRAVLLVGTLIVIAVSSSSLGLPAAAVYGLAVTVEFVLSLLAYFAGEART
jgi:hypothetical protein